MVAVTTGVMCVMWMATSALEITGDSNQWGDIRCIGMTAGVMEGGTSMPGLRWGDI